MQLDRIHSEAVSYRNWFLTWPGYHASFWGPQELSPQTRGFPVDLHLLYPYPLNGKFQGPPLGSLWQGVLFLGALAALALATTPLGRRRAARLSQPPTSRRALRLSNLTVGFGLLLALVCYSQSFDWALPLWERLPPLRAIQFPFRLLAPTVVGLALATGGALTLWLAPRRRAWVLISLVTVGLAIAGIGGRTIPLNPELSRTVGLAPGGLYTGTGEFVPKTAYWTTWHEDEARGFWLYERMFPEAAWLGGRVTVWHGTVAIRQLTGGSLWTSAEVTVAGDEPAVLAFHQLAFAGWRAWVDDHPVPATPAPWIETQAIQPGFLLVEVPPGEHRVAIRFGPSGPRLAGAAITLLGCLALAAWALTAARRSATPRHRLALRVAGLLIALGVLVVSVRLLLPLGPPPTGQPQQRILVTTVIEDLLAGRATVQAPTGAVFGPRPLPGRALSHGAGAGSPLAGRGATGAPLAKAASRPRRSPSHSRSPRMPTCRPASRSIRRCGTLPLGDGVRFIATITPTGGPQKRPCSICPTIPVVRGSTGAG